MAGIFVEGDPNGKKGSELTLHFGSDPAFRGNHGIFTPSIIGKVQLIPGEAPTNAYFPVRNEADRELLRNTYVAFDRVARFGENFADVRGSDEFWASILPKYKPAMGAKTYVIPPIGLDKDGSGMPQYRHLLLRDIRDAAHNLITDFDQQQAIPEPEEPEEPALVGLYYEGDNPATQASILAKELAGVVHDFPAQVSVSLDQILQELGPAFKDLRNLSSLGRMGEKAQRQAFSLPPEKVWAAIELYASAQIQRESHLRAVQQQASA